MTYKPTDQDIQHLIEQAKTHELGVEFLMNGSLDAVAMTFDVHAFVVDAARDQLAHPTVTIECKETVDL